ncbi:MAG: exodeoxyribonuclease VII small subunit [Candidatus Saccharibacteria bacterium]|nr:exodeoxyribonuclease VII small subunit [Candidatus Saccharibacteria bacterium]
MTAKQPFNYQAKTAELESFIAKLESGELDIDEALTAYEAAQKVLKELEAYLKTAENKVEKIKKSSL